MGHGQPAITPHHLDISLMVLTSPHPIPYHPYQFSQQFEGEWLSLSLQELQGQHDV